ncbi:formylmethanofuran--tetrahydromethanopterin formyltransferase [candidate division MSBL1 archaeon SCGC-AAA259E19]|uniref:Formylmethanofuran--tetrahydromethanopterin formyltransferase n=1 Tax=candidate division MSBL1 archaeon SCGC-AAA259E19 TaxID=1698264 RepID=A0A133ULK9_9EURY|nr:formylmethanofuran--tetrahydromethanopterin formyltransferase [candidate division MSBL1 archaeon SCGC-AAA259E19]
MRINGVEIDDTFAEAFDMVACRILVTAKNEDWALKAAREATGFATSVIQCGVEAGIERQVKPSNTPDERPGVSLLFTAMSKEKLREQVRTRIGQCIMTSPSSACYNNLEEGSSMSIGKSLRYFGDGYQVPKRVEDNFGKRDRRLWRIPVMEGEFVLEEEFKVKEDAIGGGNFFVMGKDEESVLEAAERAVEAMKELKGTITPFPGGIVRSGSKTESQYSFLHASTNTAYCPTLKSIVESKVPEGVNSVLELVINGLDEECIGEATKLGVEAACTVSGIMRISAGNYGGSLGNHFFHLYDLLEAS